MDFDKERLRTKLENLAQKGVYIGTSSWKYPGWIGQLYDESRYHYRGKLAKSRFEDGSLVEYAEVFKTVCVDASYYSFPTKEGLRKIATQVPEDFLFGFKVTDSITMETFPKLPRYGARSGQETPDFLSADRFAGQFLAALEAISNKVGVIIFELTKFHPSGGERQSEILAKLDAFFGKIPKGPPYAIELRNSTWLTPTYFSLLAQHDIAHVFNSWGGMPSVAEQLDIPGSRTNPKLIAARFLTAPGIKYQASVDAFEPYNETKVVDESARKAGAELVVEGIATQNRRTILYVNNRLEGNAINTIRAMVDD